MYKERNPAEPPELKRSNDNNDDTRMNTTSNQPPDGPLSALLRQARPREPLPPRFGEAVWRRIERAGAAAQAAPAWLVRLIQLALRPQWAAAGLAGAMVLGATLGTMQGRHSAKELAQARYLASVAPDIVR